MQNLTPLQRAVLDALPMDGDPNHHPREAITAFGLQATPPVHPLISRATLGSLRSTLGALVRLGMAERIETLRTRWETVGTYRAKVR